MFHVSHESDYYDENNLTRYLRMDKYTDKHSSSSVSSFHSKRSAGSSAIGDLGSRSDISSFENEAASTEKGFIWKNQYQHAMYFIAYTFSWGLFSSYRRGDGIVESDNVPTWFHILLVYIIFAGPMLYLQIFIGQYTQKGCIVLGAMLPVSYGVGYSMLLNTMVNCSLNMYFCSAVLYYTLISMINYPTPSWMLCLPEYNTRKRCFSRDDIDLCPSCLRPDRTGPCFNPDKDSFSASLFKDAIIFGTPTDDSTNSFLGTPNWTQAVHLVLTSIFILILAVRSLKDLDDSIRIWNVFAVVSIILTIAVILLNHPRLTFFQNMFYFKLDSLLNPECWTQAVISTAFRLNIMEGGHFLFGSYMPLTVNCTNRVTYILIVHIFFLALCNIIAFMLEDFLACSLNVRVGILSRYSDIESTFAIYPTALGILAAAQLWATLYFVILFSLTLHSIVLQIILVQETLSQEIIDPTYYIYTRIMLILISAAVAFIFTSPEGSVLAAEIFFHRSVALLMLICLVYLIVFLYGIDKFSDDIHFILHSPPSRYLKWSWVISCFVSGIILINFFRGEPYHAYPKTNIAIIIIIIIIFIPMPIGFIYQVIRAVRARELSRIMKSSNEFGPQSSEERANRRLFNPRYEVRFRRRRNFCKHRCLLGSVTLRKCLEKELILLTHVLLDIEDNEEERVLKKDFLEALHKHREIMSNALHFDPTKEYFRNRRAEFRYT